jgi:hypothetical protein
MTRKTKVARIFLFILAFVMMCVFRNCDCSGGSGPVNVKVGGQKTSGSATIVLNNLSSMVTGTSKKYVNVAFTGTLLSGTEGSGETSFNTQKTVEVTSTSVNPVPTVNRYNVHPGSWKITITAGTWSYSCTKTVNADAGTNFTFKYNTAECN